MWENQNHGKSLIEHSNNLSKEREREKMVVVAITSLIGE